MNIISHWGLSAEVVKGPSGWLYYAEVIPAGSVWLPWPGRTSRWWFEINGISPDGVEWHLCELDGGGFTLASCLKKAHDAMATAIDMDEDGDTPDKDRLNPRVIR